MSRRPTGGPGSRFLALIRSFDAERLGILVVGAGTALAVAAVLFGGYLPWAQPLSWVLYPLAVLFPLLGAVIVATACWHAWPLDRTIEPPLVEGTPPETAVTRTEYTIGRSAERTLATAGKGWFRCRPNESIADVRGRLSDGAVRLLATNRGLATDAALDAVRSGTWTDDPVAAAFLADDRRQPFAERLRAAVDPGAAHTRRVRRTLAAIEAIDDGTARTDAEVDR